MPNVDDNLPNFPSRLIELELESSIQKPDMFPASLTKVSFRKSNIAQIPNLSNLRDLNIGFLSIDGICARTFPTVEHLSFETNAHIASLPTLFPKVTDVSIRYSNTLRELPLFHTARKMVLHFLHDSIQGPIKLTNWVLLEDLTLTIFRTTMSRTTIVLPPNLQRLTIESWSNRQVSLCFPSSLTHVSLASRFPLLDITFCENSKLRKLFTSGNVFAKDITFPTTLRLFHVRLEKGEPLDERWTSLPHSVDFQVFRD